MHPLYLKSISTANDLTYNRAVKVTKDLCYGIAGATVLCASMLLWAVFGKPPYVFYGVMKLVVAGVSAGGAIVLLKASLKWLPLSIVLFCVAGVHLLGNMRKSDWVFFNWLAIVALVCLLLGVSLIAMREHRTQDMK